MRPFSFHPALKSHYRELVTDRDVKFKNLRKTYITHIALASGD